jgi:hypothetical protein
MTARRSHTRRWTACFVLFGILAVSASSVLAQTKQYVTTTLRGQLTETKGRPVPGATLRFMPEDPQASVIEATTDQNGAFEASGLVYTNYSIEIETADGELIKGLNEVPIREGDKTEIILTVSPRLESSTSLTNQPQRFVAAVEKTPKKWKKFWKQLAIYLGVTAAVGAAAEG